MSTQDEFDFIAPDGSLAPSAEDTLMFLGYCLKAYEIENEKPLMVDNELVKKLIMTSVEEDSIPAIMVGLQGENVVLQGEMRLLDED